MPHLLFTAGERPGDVAALGKLGTALAASGRLDEAIDVLVRAVAADPNHPQARTVLGRVLADQGRLEEALEHLERAAALDPANEAARRDVRAAQAQLAARQ